MDPSLNLFCLPPTPTFESQAKILIAASEANIARIESQIRDLEHLRNWERGIIARLRMAIAPVHKLPAELLAEIFLYTKDSSKGIASPFTPSQRCIRSVHALTHVCAYWRSIAHSTPRLWTEKLVMKLKKTPTAAYIACVQAWLERSAPMQIPVYLHILGKGVDAGPLMDVMVPTAHRWSDMHFDLPSLSMLSRLPNDSLKSLQRLFLRSPDTNHYDTTRAFSIANHLRRVVLQVPARRYRKLIMPWSQLTEIDVIDESPQQCLDTLIQCTTIVSAQFRTGAWEATPDLSQVQVTTLGQLEDLNVYFESTPGSITPFFVRLALPALKKLTLDLKLGQTWSSAEFTQFQLRSPNVERLELEREDSLDDTWDDGPIGPEDLLAILQHAPELVSLWVKCCMGCFDNSVVRALQYFTTQTVHLVPKLKTISLSYAINGYLDDDALDTMVQSRWWTDEQLLALHSPPHVARWSNINIEYGDEDEDNVSPKLEVKLEEYRSQGLPIFVR